MSSGFVYMHIPNLLTYLSDKRYPHGHEPGSVFLWEDRTIIRRVAPIKEGPTLL